MKIASRVVGGRKVWDLNNDALVLTVMAGGGHIAGLRLLDGPRMNPFWIPIWRTIEPWQYRPADAGRYAAKLLASICGHNICLSAFGDPSPEEARAGMQCHGEAPVVRWKAMKKAFSGRQLTFTFGCELPIAQMRMVRTLSMKRGSNLVRVTERITNLARRDVPFTMCEHVTFGPPFLEKGITVFDMCATKGHTFPGVFGNPQRCKSNTPFVWPKGPGVHGTVDLRYIGKEYRRSSDFTTQRMNPAREHAWFSAVNPRVGLLVAYVWKRSDFPWLGNWEENFGRMPKPWSRRSLTRGMEFTNAPFPVGLRKSVSMGKFQGEATYRWLPALGTVVVTYHILALKVGQDCRGVTDIRPSDGSFDVDLIV